MLIFGDVGATRTRILTIGEEMRYEEHELRGNHLEIGIERFEQNMSALGISGFELGVFGLAGIGERCEEKGRIAEVLRRVFKCDDVIVCGDSVIAFVGAFGGLRKGVLVHSGTGSFVMAYNGKEFRKYGGWGHILGDDGSGYRIAIDALREILRFWEGWGESGCVLKALRETFGIENKSDLMKLIYINRAGKSEIAKLAEGILKCAEEDEISRRIVERNAEDLLRPLPHAVNFSGSDTVSFSGGLFSSELFRNIVRKFVEGEGLLFQNPRYPPIGGAVILACEFRSRDVKKALEFISKAS